MFFEKKFRLNIYVQTNIHKQIKNIIKYNISFNTNFLHRLMHFNSKYNIFLVSLVHHLINRGTNHRLVYNHNLKNANFFVKMSGIRICIIYPFYISLGIRSSFFSNFSL
ncbi:hypothetical protein EDEG_01236 [Edhazardia aedis USNM 41457]|uniref:Uncharacterized protein n=1 Tax=Edhazardia aedis (strain USNM 41457) TaxID=1003232 RepID=J8ZY51_EDHAE|nr:hypothetical protein EDEG_01236 [Edhazardia aedis USNM 41457]|eukprot:EJW04553.1 hypothetical protein EDEG_01236 [Edhazardia aedis USNM 41457]